MRSLIPYAGQEPLEQTRPRAQRVLMAFREGQDTADIARELGVREGIILKELTKAREAERRGTA